MKKLREYARHHNLGVVALPVCPGCQIWGKPVERIYAIRGSMSLDNRQCDGVLMMVCNDCLDEMDPVALADNLELWVRSGFAQAYVAS